MIDYSANSELKKLQFFGAGPKAAVPPLNPKGNVYKFFDLIFEF